MKDKDQGKMSLGARLAYSFGAFGNDSFYGLLSGYLIMFITSHLFNTGNAAEDARMISMVTLIIMVLRIVELFIDPFIGNAIDRTKTRWGHFRPWVVVGGSISAVILLILFTNLGGLYQKNAILYMIVFAVLYITMDIFYSFKDVGFWSMLPSLTTNSREREKTATYARVGSTIGGGLVGILVMPAVIYFSARPTSTGMIVVGSFLQQLFAQLHLFLHGVLVYLLEKLTAIFVKIRKILRELLVFLKLYQVMIN